MDKVKLGIIGVGNMGCGHIGNLLKDLVPEIELVAVAALIYFRFKEHDTLSSFVKWN